MLNTENDIKRRKGLAIDAFNKYQNILCHRQTPITVKQQILHTFVYPLLLYNSELWTVTNKIDESINVLQRTLLRRMLHIRRTDRVSNVDLYNKAKETELSKEVKRRRLNWLGHMLRLSEDTPAKTALKEHIRKTKGNRGRPKHTWIKQINKDLKPINKTISTLSVNDCERLNWKRVVARLMA